MCLMALERLGCLLTSVDTALALLELPLAVGLRRVDLHGSVAVMDLGPRRDRRPWWDFLGALCHSSISFLSDLYTI